MKTLAERFTEWALDPARTLEEKFSIEVFTEGASLNHGDTSQWRQRYDAMVARQAARARNVAYRPTVDEGRVAVMAAKLEELKTWSRVGHEDRALRSMEILQFLPNLEELSVDRLETEDLAFLRHVPRLKKLRVSPGSRVQDWRAMAECRELDEVRIYATLPWPMLAGWERLEKLRSLFWHGPGLGFLEVPVLPAVETFSLQCANARLHDHGLLRDFHQLPEMPELRQATVLSLYRLDGVGRYPKLQSLLVGGPFRSLAPLAEARSLTHLRIQGEEFDEIRPLETLPELLELAISSPRPQDYTPLMEAPNLRKLVVQDCDAPQPDVAVVQAMLAPPDNLFFADSPRELPPLRLLVRPKKPENQERWTKRRQEELVEELWGGNAYMAQTEARWMDEQILLAFEAAGLHKVPGVGTWKTRRSKETLDFHTPPYPGGQRQAQVRLLRPHAISRLKDVVACLRGLLARTRHRWHILIMADPEPDADEWDEEWREQKKSRIEQAMEMLEEHEEFERERQKIRQRYADELRVRLLREQGIEPEAEDFAPPPVKPPPGAPDGGVIVKDKPEEEPEEPPMKFDPPNLDWDKRDDEDDSKGGGLAEAEPDSDESKDEHWLPPLPPLNPNLKWSEMHLYITVTEQDLVTSPHQVEAVSWLMDLLPIYMEGEGPEEEKK